MRKLITYWNRWTRMANTNFNRVYVYEYQSVYVLYEYCYLHTLIVYNNRYLYDTFIYLYNVFLSCSPSIIFI